MVIDLVLYAWMKLYIFYSFNPQSARISAKTSNTFDSSKIKKELKIVTNFLLSFLAITRQSSRHHRQIWFALTGQQDFNMTLLATKYEARTYTYIKQLNTSYDSLMQVNFDTQVRICI